MTSLHPNASRRSPAGGVFLRAPPRDGAARSRYEAVIAEALDRGVEMEEPAVKRALAAMVMADVVGYSRLMSADEPGTVRRLKECKALCVDPLVRPLGGRIIDAVGDSLFLEFASVVDATRCAIALLQRIAEWNGALPEEKRIVYRTGVNIGDVILRDRSLFGDSVNVAARLQTLAEPGGICLSGAAMDQIRQNIDANFVSLGAHAVKNIERPIDVFALSASAIANMPRESLPIKPAPPYKSLALLAGAGGLLIALGFLGHHEWLQLARERLISRLDTILTATQANMTERSRQHLIEQYLGIGKHRALAIAPRAQNHWWTGDWPSAETADEKALERCQIRFGEPCALAARDDAVLLEPKGEALTGRSMPKVDYAGPFDPAHIPGVRKTLASRPDVASYATAAEPKAAALHPRGVLITVTGAATQRKAEVQALKTCNAEPTREGDGECLLYAAGNQVVLPMRKTNSLTRP
jgi:class 3 adenylate cyclase